MSGGPKKIKECLQHVACNLCHADACRIVYPARFHPDDDAETVLEQFRTRGGDVLLDQVVQCAHCGLVYITPRLHADSMLKDYTDAAIHGYKEQFVAQNPGREIAFRKSITALNKLNPERGRLLDVGAAAGTFMAVAREHGWEAFGCEPNRWFCRWGKEHYGVAIDQGTLFDQNYDDGSFDVVTLWDVIEHTPDPLSVLEKCAALLKPGGCLVFTYPDIGSWIARVMGRRWIFLMSVHLYYFTRATITRMLHTAGFTVRTASPHIQTLQLGYILYRIKIHSAALYRTGKLFADIFGLHKSMFPYWAGINCIVAKKNT